MSSAYRRNIYLVGPMGSGKTAVGRQLARELGLVFRDSDAEIESRTGVDIPYIFEKEGERGFREREREVIAALAELDGSVVATGGGAILSEANRVNLKGSGVVIYLYATLDEQLRRTARAQNRPLLMAGDPRAVLERLMAVREPLYESLADVRLDTTGRQVHAVVHAALNALEGFGVRPSNSGAGRQ